MERPKVGVGVIVLKERKVLLQKRKGAHGEGTWCFPGGHLEFGESFEECAKREAMEETGISIRNIKFLTATNDFNRDENTHYTTIFVQSEHDAGEPRIMEPEKTDNIGWFEWDSLPSPLFLPVQNLINNGFRPVMG